MQGLGNYGSGSNISEAKEEEEEEDGNESYRSPEKKKLKQAHDHLTDSKFKANLMTKLLELGCSFDEADHATSVCGENDSLEDVFDFIQAERCKSGFEDALAPNSNPNSVSKNLGNGLSEVRDIDGAESSGSPLLKLRRCSIQETLDKWSGIVGITNYTHLASSSTENEENVRNRDENLYSKPFEQLKRMGFLPDEIQRASEDCNSIDFDVLLEYLLDMNEDDSGYETDYSDDGDDNHDDETTSMLKNMGFSVDAIRNARATCGNADIELLLCILTGYKDSSLPEITKDQTKDSHYDASLLMSSGDPIYSKNDAGKPRWTHHEECTWYSYIGKRKLYLQQLERFSQKSVEDDYHTCGKQGKHKAFTRDRCKAKEENSLLIPMDKMMGFGIPGFQLRRPKEIPRIMQGPPYFYFENVANAPNSEWQTIERHFNGIVPEFTDSRYFSACKRPRGYVHNLPIAERELILPQAPKTIFEAFPYLKKYWPPWDTRDQFNCINTRRANDRLCTLVRQIFSECDGSEIPDYRQKEIQLAVKKWNLVWVGLGQVAPLEPHEVETLLGYDRDHTRTCSGISDRYALLGNSFQVNTVAYHLSPLKYLYPDGITVLSLFSGIGGAEVSLHKAGVRLKCVISAETNEKAKEVLSSWWKKSGQKGRLIFKNDVRELTAEVLAGLTSRVGKIDLVIGGSPCNNLSGNNRHTRNGLCGEKSSLFFEFPRVLNIVKRMYSTN